jgi:hypothetical protein
MIRFLIPWRQFMYSDNIMIVSTNLARKDTGIQRLLRLKYKFKLLNVSVFMFRQISTPYLNILHIEKRRI